MRRMSAALNVYEAFDALIRSENWAEFVKANPQAGKTIEMVRDMRNNPDG